MINQRVVRFCNFLFTFMKWFILKNLKISIKHSCYHWHKHFIMKKHTNKMWKNIFCFDQIIYLKKAKKYMLQKSIIRVYASNHCWITILFCDWRIQFVETLKHCDDCFYQTYWIYFWLNRIDIWKNVKFIVFFNHNLMTYEMWF